VPALLPSNVQEELLSRLFHRDLSVPKHQTNLHLHYDVPYPILDTDLSDNAERRPSFFSYPPSSDVQFIPKDPSVHKPLSISKVMQKSLRWMTLGGQYDWTKKEYPAEAPPPFPKDVANLLEGLFPDMVAEAAIVNLYSPGDTLSLHRDVSEQCARGLVSISIGCDCVFVIGVKDASDTVVVRLRSGDAVFMSGDARFAWHGVPKIMSATCPPDISDWPAGAGGGQYEDWKGWMRNKRINLNVRQMFD
jgi:alkylated DNA repair protein alkB family protein 1